jgi:rhodanese-related sulfurtransferase
LPNEIQDLSRAITPKLLHTKIKYKETLQLIDITSSQGIKENHWNFLHIPAEELIARSNQVHQDIMVILLSEDGEKARELCTILNHQGFDNLYYLEGGLSGWEMETQSLAFTYDELP